MRRVSWLPMIKRPPWWGYTHEHIVPCSLCGGKPRLQYTYKPLTRRRVLCRLVCRNEGCAGHTGLWRSLESDAIRSWCRSQENKRHTINRLRQMGRVKNGEIRSC